MALEQRHDPVDAGQERWLTLVVRNDGSLVSTPMTLVDRLPLDWRITAVKTSRGLASIMGNEVRVALGKVRPAEQIIVTVAVEAPMSLAALGDQQCVSLLDGAFALHDLCGPLPEVRPVLVASRGSAGVAAAPRPALTLALLSDRGAGEQPSQRGATLVVRNEGAEPSRRTYLHLRFSADFQVSDVLTSLGLVGVAGGEAVIRMGGLPVGATVAVTLRGWAAGEGAAIFCATLVADGQAQEPQCGELLLGTEEREAG